MTYLEYLKKQFNDMLLEKVEEQEAAAASGSNNSGNNVSKSPVEELEDYIKNQYKNPEQAKAELPSVPAYERMEADQTTDEEIRKNAESLLSDYANQAKNAIEDDIAALEKKYAADKAGAKSGYESQNSKLDDVYSQAKESSSNDMLKRGLARSSISANIVSSLEKELAGKRSEALQTYVNAVNAIDSEISSLEGKRQKALNDFNISYAAKLTEKINDLTEKRDDQVKEALKYNNSLTDKEYEQTTQKQLDESKLYTDELNQAQKEKELGTLTESQQKQIYENIYNEMDKLLGSMSKKDAKKLFESSALFRDSLNEYYYYKLYDKYGR